MGCFAAGFNAGHVPVKRGMGIARGPQTSPEGEMGLDLLLRFYLLHIPIAADAARSELKRGRCWDGPQACEIGDVASAFPSSPWGAGREGKGRALRNLCAFAGR